MRNQILQSLTIIIIICYIISSFTVAIKSDIKKPKYSNKSENKVKKNQVNEQIINNKIEKQLDTNPFEILSLYFIRLKEFKQYDIKQLTKALEKLSISQNALKSMDGATHRLRNTIKDTSSLKARYQKFMSSSKRNLKEAAKINEYISAIERSMQAAEIIQSISHNSIAKRTKMLSYIDLVEIDRFFVYCNGLNLTVSIAFPNNTISLLNTSLSSNYTRQELRKLYSTPRQYEQDQIIISITTSQSNNKAISSILKVMKQVPKTINVNSLGFVNEEVTIQKTFLNITHQIIQKLNDYIPDIVNSTDNETDSNSIRHVRVVGFSAGGAVASYLAMLLDGTLNTTDSRLIGRFKQRVKCISIGSPPCVSRSVIPRYVTSIICGDDLICRASNEALERLSSRLLEALVAGAGGGQLSWMVGGSWIKDFASIASQGIKQYAAGSHDLSSLTVAGRVFYIKSREHKQGASIQRVMRGSWKEDMLWMLHDILLSKRMIAHHNLDYYIKTLSRC